VGRGGNAAEVQAPRKIGKFVLWIFRKMTRMAAERVAEMPPDNSHVVPKADAVEEKANDISEKKPATISYTIRSWRQSGFSCRGFSAPPRTAARSRAGPRDRGRRGPSRGRSRAVDDFMRGPSPVNSKNRMKPAGDFAVPPQPTKINNNP
jgi:hypothetical protein